MIKKEELSEKFYWLKSIWSKGLKIGYESTNSSIEKSRIMLLNGISIATAFSVIGFFIAFWIINYQYFYGPLYIIPVIIIVLYFNYTKKYETARIIYLLGSLITISYWCYEGRGNGNEYTLFALATTSTLIFNKKIAFYSSNFLCAIIFIAFKFYDYYYPFIPDSTINYSILPVLIFINSVGVVSFQMVFFRDLVNHYDNKLSIKYKELNSALTLQKKSEDELKISNESLEKNVKLRTNELLKSNDKLLKQNKLLEQFSFITSHNLRGPIARILGLNNVFDNINPSNPLNKEILAHLNTSTLALDNVIKDLSAILDFNKDLETKKEKIEFRLIIDSIKASIDINSIELILDNNQSGDNPFYSIKPYIYSIFYNILSNAVKYRSKVKQSFLKITISQERDLLKLTFEDNGIGMNLLLIGDKIFKPFERFQNDSSEEGKGIGLFLINLHVQNLEGTLAIESNLQTGTIITISLPIT